MDDHRAKIAQLRNAWQEAENAYNSEASRYFAITDATKPLPDGDLPMPEKMLDESALQMLTDLRQRADDALKDWYAALNA